MSKSMASMLIFIVSLVLGIVASMAFYQIIFKKAVPEALLTSITAGASLFQFVIGGIGLGLVIFVWTLVAVGITVAAQKYSAGKALKAATAASLPPKA